MTVHLTEDELSWIIQTLIDYEEGVSELADRLIDAYNTALDERGNR